MSVAPVAREQPKPAWRLFLVLLAGFLLAVGLIGLPPAPGSRYHIATQWPTSGLLAMTTLALTAASVWLYRRAGILFKLQSVALWLLFAPTLFCSIYSVQNSVSYLRFQYRLARDYYPIIGQCYETYRARDPAAARRAMLEIIARARAEQRTARYYGPFENDIAFAEARLAVLDESEGRAAEAAGRFAEASDHQIVQAAAFRRVMHEESNINVADESRRTPQQWRKLIGGLDRHMHVAWKAADPTPNLPETPDARPMGPLDGATDEWIEPPSDPARRPD